MSKYLKKINLDTLCWAGIVLSSFYIAAYLFTENIPLFIPKILITLIDLYLIIALGYSSILSKRKAEGTLTYGTSKMPHRLPALAMLVLYVGALIFCFSSIYLAIGKNFEKINTNRKKISENIELIDSLKNLKDSTNKTIDSLNEINGRLNKDTTVIMHYSKNIDTKFEAAYFSIATMFTLGYGDIQPVSKEVKTVVIFQLISLFILLFGVFPLLVSRLADFTIYKPKKVENVKSLFEAYSALSDELKNFSIEKTAVTEELMKNVLKYRISETVSNYKTKEELTAALKSEGFNQTHLTELDTIIAQSIKLFGKKE